MTPPARQGRSAAGGMILILLLAGLALCTIFADDIQRALTPHYTFTIAFRDARGLEAGTPVWLAGQPVGRVSAVQLIPPGQSPEPVHVHVELRTEVHDQVRHDGEIRLGTTSPMGEHIIMIEPGTPASPAIQPNETVTASTPGVREPLLDRIARLGPQLDTLSAELQSLQHHATGHTSRARELRRSLTQTLQTFDLLYADYSTSPLATLLEDPTGHLGLARLHNDISEIERRLADRAETLDEAQHDAVIDDIVRHTGELGSRLQALRDLLDTPDGLRARWDADPALLEALESTRTHLDSLIDETLRRPWRYFF